MGGGGADRLCFTILSGPNSDLPLTERVTLNPVMTRYLRGVFAICYIWEY